jgi:IS30 family transposase
VVPRDHLSQPVHPGSRRSEKAADGALAAHSRDASLATPCTEDQHPRSNHWPVSISECPPAFEDRALPGHWEGDLLFGSKNSQIATLVERQSRYVMLAKVGKKDTETVVNALIKHAQKLPQGLYRSLTWDRGKEMADHRRF